MKQVISGGQTGADRIGLEVATAMSIPTGGMAPKNWRTENGSDLSLKDFGMTESNTEGYVRRTIHNLTNSDGTVLFGDMDSPGSLLTISKCLSKRKPHITNPNAHDLAIWIRKNRIETLNVAGNRGSKLDNIKQSGIRNILVEAFTLLGYSLKVEI